PVHGTYPIGLRLQNDKGGAPVSKIKMAPLCHWMVINNRLGEKKTCFSASSIDPRLSVDTSLLKRLPIPSYFILSCVCTYECHNFILPRKSVLLRICFIFS